MLIETTYGPVEGFLCTYGHASRQNADGQGPRPPISKWLGIPYAQAGRWERPSAPAPWTEPMKAHEFGTAFPQPNSATEALLKDVDGFHARDWVRMSEQSHFVNVFGPKDCQSRPRTGLLPTLFFIYGGSLNNGSSERPLYDPTELVRAAVEEGKPTLVVSFNYRTNCLGFMASPDLASLDPAGLCGNYGAYDCIAALEWVQANIERFGGDPDNVTIMGHSAGGFLVSQLLVTGRRLFRKACAHSGAASTMGLKPVGQSYPAHSEIVSRCGGTHSAATAEARVDALRKVDWQDLLRAHTETYKFGGIAMTVEPESEASIWTKPTIERLEAGEWDPWIESVVLGTTEDEGSLFVVGLGLTTLDAGRQWIEHYPSPLREQLEQKYFAADTATVTNVLTDSPASKILRDQFFVNPAFEQATALASNKNRQTGKGCTVWKYRVRSEIDCLSRRVHPLGALHVVEIPLVLNVCSLWSPCSHEEASAKALRQRWLAYIAHGNPEWKPFDAKQPTWLAFEKGGTVKNEEIKDVMDGMLDFTGRRTKMNPVATVDV